MKKTENRVVNSFINQNYIRKCISKILILGNKKKGMEKLIEPENLKADPGNVDRNPEKLMRRYWSDEASPR